jgi:hypothetical protein
MPPLRPARRILDCRPNFLHWRIDAPSGGKAVFDRPQAASILSILLEILSDAHCTCHPRPNSTALPPLDISSSHLQQNVGQLEAALALETKRTGKAISDCSWAARLPDTAISGQPISINSACHSSVTAYFHGYWIRAADSLPHVPSRPLHSLSSIESKRRFDDRVGGCFYRVKGGERFAKFSGEYYVSHWVSVKFRRRSSATRPH